MASSPSLRRRPSFKESRSFDGEVMRSRAGPLSPRGAPRRLELKPVRSLKAPGSPRAPRSPRSPRSGSRRTPRARSPSGPSSRTYKTRLCTNYLHSGGYCRFADSCWFAHGPSELRARPGGAQSSSSPTTEEVSPVPPEPCDTNPGAKTYEGPPRPPAPAESRWWPQQARGGHGEVTFSGERLPPTPHLPPGLSQGAPVPLMPFDAAAAVDTSHMLVALREQQRMQMMHLHMLHQQQAQAAAAAAAVASNPTHLMPVPVTRGTWPTEPSPTLPPGNAPHVPLWNRRAGAVAVAPALGPSLPHEDPTLGFGLSPDATRTSPASAVDGNPSPVEPPRQAGTPLWGPGKDPRAPPADDGKGLCLFSSLGKPGEKAPTPELVQYRSNSSVSLSTASLPDAALDVNPGEDHHSAYLPSELVNMLSS